MTEERREGKCVVNRSFRIRFLRFRSPNRGRSSPRVAVISLSFGILFFQCVVRSLAMALRWTWRVLRFFRKAQPKSHKRKLQKNKDAFINPLLHTHSLLLISLFPFSLSSASEFKVEGGKRSSFGRVGGESVCAVRPSLSWGGALHICFFLSRRGIR